MVLIRRHALIAGTAMMIVQAALSGCTHSSVAPSRVVYERPSHIVKSASRPHVPPQVAGRSAGQPAGTPALSEADKSNLFQQFDEWESRRANGAPSEPADLAASARANRPDPNP